MSIGGKRNRTRPNTILLAAALFVLPAIGISLGGRTLSGVVHFTNNTPPDRKTFPVELFSVDKKKLVATAERSEPHRFSFADVKPGKYLLKFIWPQRCELWYRVDLTKESKTDIRIIMDAACAHANRKVQDLPEP